MKFKQTFSLQLQAVCCEVGCTAHPGSLCGRFTVEQSAQSTIKYRLLSRLLDYCEPDPDVVDKPSGVNVYEADNNGQIRNY